MSRITPSRLKELRLPPHGLVALGGVAALLTLTAFGGSQDDLADELAFVGSSADSGAHVRPLEDVQLVGDEQVARWIDHFRTRDTRTVGAVVERLGAYEQVIGDRLAMRGLPAALVYVPAIESAISATARSQKDAVGLWQLREETAIELGLRVDEWVDERRDPVRATDAALDYLERLRDRFGSWELALLAYNAGPSRVARRLRWYAAPEATPAERFSSVVTHLPRETREYLPKLIATRILAESILGASPQNRPDRYLYDEVMVPPGTSLWRLADAYGATISELRRLNPHLLLYTTPPESAYPVRVPVGISGSVVAVLRGLAQPGEPTA